MTVAMDSASERVALRSREVGVRMCWVLDKRGRKRVGSLIVGFGIVVLPPGAYKGTDREPCTINGANSIADSCGQTDNMQYVD